MTISQPVANSSVDLNNACLKAQSCTKCTIRNTSTQVVYGKGPATAELMIVGEAPGYNEDKDGIPFTGKAGQLLDTMLTYGMGIQPSDVYFANILKCRPPQNRDPLTEEVNNCTNWLYEQISIIKPKVIMAMGKFASSELADLDPSCRMGDIRGQSFKLLGAVGASPIVVPTWHPAYLLRNLTNMKLKSQSQQDMNTVLELLEKPIIIERYPST